MQSPSFSPPTESQKLDAEQNGDIAALCYVPLLAFFLIIARRQSGFVRFHGRQGIALSLLAIAFWVIPVVGKILELLILAAVACGFLLAAARQWKEVPVIGPLSRGHVVPALKQILLGFTMIALIVRVIRALRAKRKKMTPASVIDVAPASSPPIAQTSSPSSSFAGNSSAGILPKDLPS
ncbi:hypothetical protein HY285_05620 [Candidatus Peregrinibacteria bacterium]|nr:hypothetical protein [Candidatus Peregrinibacteria bacterium]MBI3816987.1 hypothetical protein [Candidatus Peregrinibacteria bacterium]